jgi:hypothetical protein
MAHYAFIDENNIVVDVITGRNENEVVDGISDWEKHYEDLRGMKCLRTSYNGNIRKNFAGIGYNYDSVRDAFIAPKPEAKGVWVLNEETCQWEDLTPLESDETQQFQSN